MANSESRKRLKARAKRVQRKHTATIRQYVFARERNICRCCRFRRAESMHELLPRGRGGHISKRNSVALCGDGVRGCHGLLTRSEIVAEWDILGAEEPLLFNICSRAAADWCRVSLDNQIISPPMIATEAD